MIRRQGFRQASRTELRCWGFLLVFTQNKGISSRAINNKLQHSIHFFSRVSADILKQPSGCQKEIVKEISNLPRTQWTSDPQVLVTSQSPSNMLLLPGDCNCLFDRAQDPTTGAAELPVEVIRVVEGETTRATLPLSTWWGGSSWRTLPFAPTAVARLPRHKGVTVGAVGGSQFCTAVVTGEIG